jgi:hypothetical protein
MASSVPATVKNSHFFCPVLPSTPKIGRDAGHSPPWAPMITLSFTTSGAPVKPTVIFLESEQLGVPHQLAALQIEARSGRPSTCADVEIAVSDGDAAVVGRMRLLGDQLFVELRRVGPDCSCQVAPSSAQTRL